MDFGRKYIQVGKYDGYTHPVSEGRAELISKVLKEEHETLSKFERFSDVPRKVVGDLRRKKAESLIDFKSEVPTSFYEGKDYPVSVIDDALIFFSSYAGRI